MSEVRLRRSRCRSNCTFDAPALSRTAPAQPRSAGHFSANDTFPGSSAGHSLCRSVSRAGAGQRTLAGALFHGRTVAG